VPPFVIFGPLSVDSWQQAWLDQVKISRLSQANVVKNSEKSMRLWKKWRVISDWV